MLNYILVGAVLGHTSVLAACFRLVVVVGILLPPLSYLVKCVPKVIVPNGVPKAIVQKLGDQFNDLRSIKRSMLNLEKGRCNACL